MGKASEASDAELSVFLDVLQEGYYWGLLKRVDDLPTILGAVDPVVLEARAATSDEARPSQDDVIGKIRQFVDDARPLLEPVLPGLLEAKPLQEQFVPRLVAFLRSTGQTGSELSRRVDSLAREVGSVFLMSLEGILGLAAIELSIRLVHSGDLTPA